MKRIRRIRYKQDRPSLKIYDKSAQSTQLTLINPEFIQVAKRPLFHSIVLVQQQKSRDKLPESSFNLQKNQNNSNANRSIVQQCKASLSPLNINLDKFQDYFVEIKKHQRLNMLFDFRVQTKQTYNKKSITTFHRYPSTSNDATLNQVQQQLNNFIVEKVKGTNKQKKPRSFNKFIQSLNMSHNFEGKKVQNNIQKFHQFQQNLNNQNRQQKFLSLRLNCNSINKTIEKKMTYQNFLDLVLNSNNLRLKQISFPHFYNVYVEQGNNHQIIRTLARRKNGWRVVESPEVANLIWTQKYKKSLGVRPKRAGNVHLYAQLRQKINEVAQRERQSKKQSRDALIATSSKIRKQISNISNSSRGETMSSFYRNSKSPSVSLHSDRKNVQATIQVLSKEQQDYDQMLSRITKSKNMPKKLYQDFIPSLNITILNHMPGNRCICDKKNLLSNLFDFYTARKKDPFQYIPYSVTVRSFEELLQKKAQFQRMNTAWIIKPGQDTNRGKGITVCSNWSEAEEEIKQRLGLKGDNQKLQKQQSNYIHVEKNLVQSIKLKSNNQKAMNSSITLKYNKTLILQRYISPFLYQKRKFDIRTYLLVTCSNSKIKAYFYQEGYIRTCSMPFSMKNNNKYIHLTNDAVQKYATDYGRYQQGNKLSYHQFQKWFTEETQKINEISGKSNSRQQQKFSQNQATLIEKDVFQQLSSSFMTQTQNGEQKQANNSRWKQIRDEMIKISKDVIKSVKNKIILSNQRAQSAQDTLLHFELYGLDFMIDENTKLWLIEVNNNPSLTTDCSRLLARLIPAMLDNMLMISVQPYMRPHKIRQGKYQNRFEVIYEENG